MKVFTKIKDEAVTQQQFHFNKSFGPFIRFLKVKQNKSADIRGKFYRYLIKKFEQQPHLVVPFKDATVLEQHHDLVHLLRMSLLPLTANTEDVPMALAFLQPGTLFYYTPLFKKILIDENIEFDTLEDIVGSLRYFLKLVLERCYNVKSDVNTRMLKQVSNIKEHHIRHYQISIDSRFIEVHVTGQMPLFDEAWPQMLNAGDEEFLKLFGQFPAHNFSLEGFCMLNAEDVSEEVALNQLKNAVLNIHALPIEKTLSNVEIALGELTNNSDMKISITPFYKINGRVVYDKSIITKCVGIASQNNEEVKEWTMDEVYKALLKLSGPVIYQDDGDKPGHNTPYHYGLHYNKVKSFVVYPIKNRDQLIGAFEIGSPQINTVNEAVLHSLRPAIPLLTELINYMLEMFNARIEQVVKEKFTPLQETVEWKFNEVAWKYLLQQNDNKKTSIDNVVFKNVYPLYAAVDIRNSSVERNLASKNDYLFQLHETLDILQQAFFKTNLPLIETIVYKCEKFVDGISDMLTSEDELNIREFLEEEAYVLFKHIAERDESLAELIKAYMQKTDRDTGDFHKNHKAYEESVNRVNSTMNDFFSAEMKRLKAIYPFYFEKYKTDGVEYNIYIGGSIVPDKPFDVIYLKNLRAWQVSSMAYVTQLNARVCNSLPLPLQTTQLILVHGTPIDISFRKDERRFDVEGAYNIRYEILKKRIDKVRIKGTQERLTQPGKIAIVYSNSVEIQEYLHHIQYLQNKGLLTDTLEMVDLESLQGISGLKAVRVGVATPSTPALMAEEREEALLPLQPLP